MSATIQLSRGMVALVDEDDLELVLDYCQHWRAKLSRRKHSKDVFYAICSSSSTRTHTSMHRLILNAPKGLDVDHISGNGLDNRRFNLRLATEQQNCLNRRIRSGGLSRFKGVTWNKTSHKWQAQIEFHGKNHYLGVFVQEEAAARAYDARATELFGDFAVLNLPQLIGGQP